MGSGRPAAARPRRTELKVSIVLFASYAIWCAVLFAAHEPWRDEVQSWLLARDLDFVTLLSQLRYDGHPAGWFLFLWPMARLGLPFVAERALHALIVLACGWLICFRAPGGLPMRLFLLLATPMMYELPALSRNYAMSALALLVMGLCHRERFGKYCAVYCVALFLLINSNVYGTIAGIALLGGEILLLLLRRFFPGLAKECSAVPSRGGAALALTYVFSLFCAWLVLFSNVLIPLNPVPLYEDAHFLRIQNYGFDAARLGSAVSRVGDAAALGALPGDIGRFLPGVSSGSLTVLLTALILLAIAGAALTARRATTRITIAAIGLAAYFGNVLAVAVTTIFNIRHAVPFIFLVVYLWWTALSERSEAPEAMPGRRAVRGMALALASVVFIGAVGLNVYRARRDILYPYSMAEKTAAFLKESGYDSGDVLILAANHPQTSTLLGFTDDIKTLRFVYGDCSFAVWQVYNSDYEHSFDLGEFAASQLAARGDEYRAVLFVASRAARPLDGVYPVIYDSGGGSIMEDESYVVYRLK